MTVLDAHKVDPRDTQWEIDQPPYRVHFFERRGAQQPTWESEEWELNASDVTDVLAWAEATSRDRPHVVYAYVSSDSGSGLVRLFGSDPNSQVRDG